ncbi:hypothetical protein, partial [uncultured Thiodictyon sp.]|uniref:hypothetical protein n=1 Tax=uncultured Thiodictyon sp. TaxID=1846217 RepID=UPI0025DB9FAF
DAKGITLGTHRAQTFSVKRFPDRIAFGMAARYIGDVVSGTRGIRHNVRITLSGVSSSIRSPRRASTDVSYPGPTASSSSPTW